MQHEDRQIVAGQVINEKSLEHFGVSNEHLQQIHHGFQAHK